MAGMVNITVDKRQMEDIVRLLADVKNGVSRVLTRAINKVGVAARTRIVRLVAGVANLKVSDIRNRNVRLHKANFSTLTAHITVTGRRIPLISFKARQMRRGVTYAIRKGKRSQLAGNFITTMPTGHRGVFSRRTAQRLPIDEKFGPSVPELVRSIGQLATSVLDKQIADDLDHEINMQVGLVLRRRGRYAA